MLKHIRKVRHHIIKHRKKMFLGAFSTFCLVAFCILIISLQHPKGIEKVGAQAGGNNSVSFLVTPTNRTVTAPGITTMLLSLRALGTNITAIDITIRSSNPNVLTLQNIQLPGQFKEVTNNVSQGAIHFIGVNKNPLPLTGTITIGTITVDIKSQGTAGIIIDDSSIVLGPGTTRAATNKQITNENTPIGSYVLPTPTPTATPTPRPTATPTPQPLPAPTNLSSSCDIITRPGAANPEINVVLRWNRIEGASKYNFHTTGGRWGTRDGASTLQGTGAVITALYPLIVDPGIEYTWSITPIDQNSRRGNTSVTQIFTCFLPSPTPTPRPTSTPAPPTPTPGPLPAPTGLTATCRYLSGAIQVDLDWSSVSGADSYKIRWNGNNYTARSSSYGLSGVDASVPWTWYVQAVKASGQLGTTNGSSFTCTAPTATPTPRPTSTPTPIPPTPTPTSCIKPKSQGNADGNCSIDNADYNIWAQTFGTRDTRADFNNDNQVNIRDFAIWRDYAFGNRR